MGIKNSIGIADRRRQLKPVFIASCLAGIVAHGMGIFNKYSLHDDPVFLFSVGMTYTSGRWGLELFDYIERHYLGSSPSSMPVFNGFLALSAIALAACFVVELLELKEYCYRLFIGAIMACFPVVTCIFGFMYAAHYYMISMLAGVAGAYLICKGRNWISLTLGIGCIAFSLGIYQAFLPFSLSLILLYWTRRLSIEYDSISSSQVIKRIVLAGLCVITSLLLYFSIGKLDLLIKHAQLSSYKGLNEVGNVPLSAYMRRIVIAYREYFMPAQSVMCNMYPHKVRIIYYIFVTGIIILSIKHFRQLFKKDKCKAMIFAVLMALLPLCANLIFVMVDPTEVHSLMVYGQLATFFALISLVDGFQSVSCVSLISALKKGLLIFLCAMLFMYCRFDNRCYLNAAFTQQQAISYFTTLTTQIKSTENYTDELPVAFINPMAKRDKSFSELKQLDDSLLFPYFNASYYLNVYSWRRFMANWCGYTPDIVEEDRVKDLPSVVSMPYYPDQGSIAVIDGIVVVKF